MENTNCLLDNEIFKCCKCGGKFSHIEGTWLPTGRLIYTNYCTMLPEGTDKRFPNVPVAYFSLEAPKIETSDKFTCYDCCENEGEEFMDCNYDVA